jgi:uroporphyrin-3 C-methyltransferase
MSPQSIEPSDELSEDTTTPRPPSNHCIIAWSAIGLLLATWLCLFLGITFFWKKNNNSLSEESTHFTQIQKQLSDNQTKYQALQKNLIQLQALIQKNFSSGDTMIRIGEASQLIQLAHYNLIYLHDQSSALSALISADTQLAKLSNSPVSLDALRNRLAQNIASLKASPPLDLNRILMQLNALQSQVTQLPLLNTTPTSKQEISAKQHTTSEKKWLSAIQASLHSFQQLIVIRHLAKPIQPLLPEVQQQYLTYNLQLLLQQAQWALIHQQQEIYQTSLQQAKHAIQQHFAESASITQTMIQNINELEKINLQPTVPDLTPALQAIHSISQTLSSPPPGGQKEVSL